MKLFLAVMALASAGCDAAAATQDGPATTATVKIDDV